MSANKPETPADVHLTPVEFSPPSQDAIGTVGGRIPLREFQFPLSVPVAIILLTLICSTVRDISGFNRRLADIERQDAPSLEKLKRVPKQTEFIESLRKSLVEIAPTDPNAATILKQYFPPPPKLDNQAAPAK